MHCSLCIVYCTFKTYFVCKYTKLKLFGRIDVFMPSQSKPIYKKCWNTWIQVNSNTMCFSYSTINQMSSHHHIPLILCWQPNYTLAILISHPSTISPSSHIHWHLHKLYVHVHTYVLNISVFRWHLAQKGLHLPWRNRGVHWCLYRAGGRLRGIFLLPPVLCCPWKAGKLSEEEWYKWHEVHKVMEQETV